MPPPELARDAPGLDVAQPLEIDLLVGLGLEHRIALLHSLQRGLGQGVGVNVPLVRQPGLDDHARAVAVRDDVFGLLDLLQPTLGLGAGDDGLSGDEAVEADQFSRDLGRVIGGDGGEGVQDVDRRQARPLSDAEVVEVVGGRDLDRARALGRIGIVVGDDRHATAGDRQDDLLADERGIAFVVRMDCDAGVAEHGLGPGRGDDDVVAGLEGGRLALVVELDRVFERHAVGERIGEVPIRTLDLALLDLKVRDGRLELRIPVHQPLVAIDQFFLMQLHEDLADGGVQPLVQGEAFARPVAGRAQAAQLLHDRAATLGLPLPDLLDEGLTADLATARVALSGHLALDHHLGCDASVVRARQPQHRLARHAVIAGQHVLQRVVQRVADVQRARHVRRRNDDRIGFGGPVSLGGEGAALFPLGVEAWLGGAGVEGLLKHRRYPVPLASREASGRGRKSAGGKVRAK